MEIKLNRNSKLLFITKNGDPADCSKSMMLSFVRLIQLFNNTDNVQFICEAKLEFDRSFIYVVEHGHLFERLAAIEAIAVTPGTILNSKLSLLEPIFHSLVITTTGISEAERNEVMKLVKENGGTYISSFNSKTTDILITQPNLKNSDKLDAAVKCRKECLVVSWVKDSVAKGYSLPYADYRIFVGQTSSGNIFNSSQFNGDKLNAETTSESLALSPVNKELRHKSILDEIDISLVGNAKGCLNGCTIWLCGFDASAIDNLKRMINILGGICIDELGENVGYAIVEKPNTVELSTLKSLENLIIVTKDWLLACINAKRITDPKEYMYKVQESSSHSTQPISSVAINENIDVVNEVNLSNTNEAATVPKMEIDYEIVDLDDLDDEDDEAAAKPVPNICLGLIVENAEILMKQIVEIGGTVCVDSSEFDKPCTHLICSKPNQSEKTLRIVASGGWLLCPAYVEDSFKAGHFLDEEDYEWGNPKAKSKLPSELDGKSEKIAMGSFKWRKELQLKSKKENKSVGIFSGFRVIIHSSQKDSFKRLLEAGCGVVVDLKEPYSQQKDFQRITHCFVDKRMKEIPDNEKAAMIKAGVHLVNILYLQACVQDGTFPPVEAYAAK